MLAIAKQKNNIELEMIETAKEILDYRKAAEANIVSILWKNTELIYQYDKLIAKDFSNNCWRVYFVIASEIIIKERKKTLDDITVGLYLNEHPKLKEKYEEFGSYKTIDNAKAYVKEENIDGYIRQLNKWKVVGQLLKYGFPIKQRMKEFIDMNAEEIYDEYEATLNHVFINIEQEDPTYNIGHNIHGVIDEWNEGSAVGLPLYNSPLLTKETGGNLEGNITLCGALSGVGKSSFTRNVVLPSIIDKKEKVIIMINEEDLKKVQREMIVWVANNIYKTNLKKYIVRNGKYSNETLLLLKKCADWIKEHEEYIIIIPFSSFSTAKAIKVIKKYSSLGVKYFILDTFKNDQDAKNDALYWMDMKNNMVKIYDIIKGSVKNVHIWITFQLAKNSSKQRYYTQENIGESKSIVDVGSTCLMIRNIFEDEFEGERRELRVFHKIDTTNVPVKLEKGKHYQVIFIVKNREGSANDFQIVVEHNLATNVYEEIGITRVPCDF